MERRSSLIVGPANGWMSRFHDRMPVILDRRDAEAWMRGDDPIALLKPAPEDALREWVVSTLVNRAGAYALISPVAASPNPPADALL